MPQPQAAVPKERVLPTKQANLFKDLVQNYEFKQYKKGLKNADHILKKFPEHGETLALKGLFLSHLGRREEALQCIKLGIRKDIASHVCWHVFGLYYRAERNYKEAIRCYKTALKYDPQNLQIMRDLSVLQIQLRDYDGFLAIKLAMVEARPSLRAHWMGLAIAYHLSGDLDAAVKVLDAFLQSWRESVANGSPSEDKFVNFEISEILMYKIQILLEAQLWQVAISELTKIKHEISDENAFLEYLALAFQKNSQPSEAIQTYQLLLKKNPCSVKALSSLESLSCPADDPEAAIVFCRALLQQFPESALIIKKRILTLLNEHAIFKQEFKDFFRPLLVKNVPSLFSLYRSLIKDNPQKLQYIKQIYAEELESSSREAFYPWLLFSYSQLLLTEGLQQEAHTAIDDALKYQPENIDFLMQKAKILKHLHDFHGAANVMNQARLLDLSDKFVNCKCAKYYLRAGMIEEAKQTIALFIKGDYPAKLVELMDIQTHWWQVELADAYYNAKNYGMAMKCYDSIIKQYEDFVEDQVDFHTYSIRKMSLRSYIELLRFEDKIHENHFFTRAVTGMLKCYQACLKNNDLVLAQRMQKLSVDQAVEASSKLNQDKGEAKKRANHDNQQTMHFDDNLKPDDKDGDEAAAPIVKNDPDPNGLLYLEGDLHQKYKSLVETASKLLPSFNFYSFDQ